MKITKLYKKKKVALLSILFFILLFLKRRDQLIHPDIWNEDGTINLVSYLDSGWFNLFEPVQGYYITISKIITNISMSISPLYYPEISTYITWVFIIVVSLIVVYAPTILEHKILSAIIIYFIPAYAEVYGLPLYTFWFAGIFILLVALWQEQKNQLLKNILLIIGGLSSPIIVTLIPVQIYRLIILKNKREELITLIISIILSFIQLNIMLNQHAIDTNTHFTIEIIKNLYFNGYIAFYFGKYYLGALLMSDYSNWIAKDFTLLLYGGVALLIFLLVALVVSYKDKWIYIFYYLLFAMLASTLYRTHFEITYTSPRYFFYIYIVLSWLIIYISNKNRYFEYISITIIILSMITSMQIFCKESEYLNWRQHLHNCANSKNSYSIPIHFAGSRHGAWHITLNPKQCKELIENRVYK